MKITKTLIFFSCLAVCFVSTNAWGVMQNRQVVNDVEMYDGGGGGFPTSNTPKVTIVGSGSTTNPLLQEATCVSQGSNTSCPSGQYLSCGRCYPCADIDPNCATCRVADHTPTCTSCSSGYSLNGNINSCEADFTVCPVGKYKTSSRGTCVDCVDNATCPGGMEDFQFTCDSGYEKNGAGTRCEAVSVQTVSSCPSHMIVSSDGCCCYNK